MNCVEVEISVFKPIGYAAKYIVIGTKDRFFAVEKALDEFKKTDGKSLTCLNYINAKPTSKNDDEHRTVILLDYCTQITKGCVE